MPTTPPKFTFGRQTQGNYNHRPAFSSPLSSSPIRASSLSPPALPHDQQMMQQPLSPCKSNFLNALPRQTQSSPIMDSHQQSGFYSSENGSLQPPKSAPNNKFRFASRNPRPNPMLKRREEAQEGRRRLFFQNVRQRQDDKRWDMRGGKDELYKLEWWRQQRERALAMQAEEARQIGFLDADMVARDEEEMRMHYAQPSQHQLDHHQHAAQNGTDMDAMMADAIALQEQAEMDALISAMENGQDAAQTPFKSGQFSDDEDDYDGLFMDFIQQQQQQQHQQQNQERIGESEDVEMT
ncbi:uncharacterized protein C8A04DRAFT_23785 [Dichotomopilus funicola]|uniref:Uncharacterized protein n=1 Tax=Dichotomopilus funicola TaxID=1934379 RepID=A0AAN6VBE9_9PEZI|nr:hypothetical protein C8A04DRAFT_23785 [Dichotomopilus funicola]